MKNVIIYGAGPYGKLFLSEAERWGSINVEAFTVDQKYLIHEKEMGLSVVPFEEVDKVYPPDKYDMLVVCGYTRMRNRKEMYDKAKAKGYSLPNYISPGAYLETEINMGDNNIFFTGCNIGHEGKMGNNNIIRQNVYLGHDFKLDNHIIISVGCTIGGYSEIGDLSFLGFSVTASGFKKFGKECLIGAGSVVTHNVDSFAKCYGNPAKVVSYHQETGVLIKEGDGNVGFSYN